MGFFDMVQALRRGEPDPCRAARGLQIAGWACLVILAWNLFTLALLRSHGRELPFRWPQWLQTVAVAGTLLAAGLLLHAAQAIRQGRASGRREGQAGLLLLCLVGIGLSAGFFPGELIRRADAIFVFFLVGIVAVATVQVGVVVFFAMRYLQRLELQEELTSFEDVAAVSQATPLRESDRWGHPAHRDPYVEALVPGGVYGAFALVMAVCGASMAAAVVRQREDGATALAVSIFVLALLSPAVYNFFTSRFEEGRKRIASFTGGGAVGLLQGTWPFFRILVYSDGLEVRLMFTRYFIPFDALAQLPEPPGFLSLRTSAVLESDLPGVPQRIRFVPLFGISGFTKLVEETRREYVETHGATVRERPNDPA